MNERIKEIAKQAGLKVNADGEIGPAFFGSVNDGYREFAKLVVQECARKLEEDGMVEVAMEIKEYFGVE